MSTWTNEDGLAVKFGTTRSVVETDGSKGDSNIRVLEVHVTDATTIGATDTAAIVGDEPFIPANAVIVGATFDTSTDFTGSSSTLDIGYKVAAGTNVNGDNAIDAAVALAALTDATGVVCDGVGVGLSVGTANVYPIFTYGTAVFTAGAGVLRVEYMV